MQDSAQIRDHLHPVLECLSPLYSNSFVHENFQFYFANEHNVLTRDLDLWSRYHRAILASDNHILSSNKVF